MLRTAALSILVLLVASGRAAEIPKDATDNVGLPSQDGILLTKAPQNTAVSVGSTVTLTCWVSGANGFSESIQWVEYTNNSTGRVISIGRLIAPCHPEKDRYKIIHRNPLQYDLVISNVNINDGGLYACSVVNGPIIGRHKKAQAQLVVIGEETCSNDFSYPGENQLFENRYYTAKCDLKFGGNIVPFAQWVGPQAFDQYQRIDKPNTVQSGISFHADTISTDKSWTLTFNFSDNFLPVPADTATNIPSFELKYNTPAVNIVWKPRNVNITPVKEMYSVGDEITCSADANPTATYFRQQDWYSGDVFYGPVLVIPQKWAGRTQQDCSCTVCNYIDDVSYCEQKFYRCYVQA